ncbi:hypothetical protein JCM16303_006696 [Sporobolomyces ruberrimus]
MPHSVFDPASGQSPPLDDRQTAKSVGKSCLHPGSTWVGVQRSGRNSYDVKVQIDTVDIEAGTLAGTLEIKHLTPELESLVTFFEGEIVSETGPGFLTANYGATKEDDMRHWRRFPPFTRNRLEQQMNGPNLNLRGASKKPYLFMRWKERFVLPEHKVDAIHGASFAGLYYICLDFEPTSSELFAEASPSLHRGISPPSSRPFSFAAPLPRRRTSQTSPAPSQLAQTRPPVSALLQPPLVPIASTAPIAIERPVPVQRTVSYAAALRGGDGPVQPSTSPSSSIASSSLSSSVPPSLSTSNTSSVLSVTPPTPSTTPPPPELPTPKSEYDASETIPSPRVTSAALATSFLDLTTSPDTLSRTSGFTSTRPPPVTITPLSSTPSDSEEWPSIPLSPPSMTSQSSFPSPPLASPAGMTRRSSGRGRKDSRVSGTIGDGFDAGAQQGEEENFGFKSWTEASLTGFYHFACSEPYQQLSLRYVPTTNGGSQSFEFL